MMKLAHLLTTLPTYKLINRVAEIPDIDIFKITSDSRQVKPGTLFVAYRGVNLDGHRFIADAIKAGAVAIICEDEGLSHLADLPLIVVPDGREALAWLSAAWHDFPARQLTMVGITGTDGKTTTTNILYHITKVGHKKVGMINTINAVIGQEVIETGLHTTTPDSPDVQRYLAQMVEADTELCLLEVTSHALAHHRVTACDFDIAVITNITHEHLDLHGSLENYRAAKASLFESLATAVDKGRPKTAVLNCDDWSFEYLKQKLAVTGISWLGYSLTDHPEASLTAQNISYHPAKTCFTIRGGYKFQVETTLIGDYNVSNCLAAAVVALELLGVSAQTVRQALATLPPISGRMERINIGQGQNFMTIVDFAHTPNSMRRALSAARAISSGRVIAVFGSAGLRDLQKRAMMGHIAAELADISIITAEDPRTENLEGIINSIAEAMLADRLVEGQSFERIPDRGRAIYRAIQLARPDDIVIVLGKGHEQTMCFGNTEYEWDDRQAVRVALRGKPLLSQTSQVLRSACEVYKSVSAPNPEK